jgi:hypothetical protein
MDRIRAHARAQVARTSLRKVAKSAGVKVGATKKFVDGSEPYERNARLWKRWYTRELNDGRAGVPDDALPTHDARVSLEILLWSIPEEDRPRALTRTAALFRDLYTELGHVPPRWALELSGSLPPEPAAGGSGEPGEG